ncbi:tetratricopeptide repeat protein [Roseovarius sp. CAU 1744]|uniref:tetratricopeptide repeat protein n=1 Tax=Roseovarius sp. CAU 1744 TaxID=3140368 RepID=UPI00325AA610
MSDTDSFIDEVTEEVRRDRLFKAMRRYGWIAVLAVIAIVGGAAWNEWTKAQARASAEAFGDDMLAALSAPDGGMRVAALSDVEAPGDASQAMIDLLAAGELSADAPAEAAERLLALADREGIDTVYRQIAMLKAVSIPGSGLSIDERRNRMEGLALGSGVARLLAEEQLAMIEVELGDTGAAIERLQQLVVDAEATTGLRTRASQVIVALGGEMPGNPSGEPANE